MLPPIAPKRFLVFMLLDAPGLPRGEGGARDFMATDDGERLASFDTFDQAREALSRTFPFQRNIAQIFDSHTFTFVNLKLDRVWVEVIPPQPPQAQQQRQPEREQRSDRGQQGGGPPATDAKKP